MYDLGLGDKEKLKFESIQSLWAITHILQFYTVYTYRPIRAVLS